MKTYDLYSDTGGTLLADVENDNILPFLNRLSDLLFQMVRKVDQTENGHERLWKGD
jgi:cob(I)alamin adenosyltransferase